NWTVHEFNTMPVPEFLSRVDFHVYLHHPGLVEAFGRVVLEGLAAGAVCFAPPSLEPIFGDAVSYGDPEQVRGFVDRLWADPDEYARRSAHGIAFVVDRFSHQAHRRRIAELIGAPSSAERPVNDTPRPATKAPQRKGGSAERPVTGPRWAPGWVRTSARTGLRHLSRVRAGLRAMTPPRPRIATPPAADHVPADAPV